jgi:hypothetical protein
MSAHVCVSQELRAGQSDHRPARTLRGDERARDSTRDESKDRAVRRRSIVLVTLVVIGLSIAAFIANPLLLPLSVLIACLGVLADRHLPRGGTPDARPPNPPDSG